MYLRNETCPACTSHLATVKFNRAFKISIAFGADFFKIALNGVIISNQSFKVPNFLAKLVGVEVKRVGDLQLDNMAINHYRLSSDCKNFEKLTDVTATRESLVAISADGSMEQFALSSKDDGIFLRSKNSNVKNFEENVKAFQKALRNKLDFKVLLIRDEYLEWNEVEESFSYSSMVFSVQPGQHFVITGKTNRRASDFTIDLAADNSTDEEFGDIPLR